METELDFADLLRMSCDGCFINECFIGLRIG